MDMKVFSDKVWLIFGQEYDACTFISADSLQCAEGSGSYIFHPKGQERYLLDGVRLNVWTVGDGNEGTLYLPVSSVKAFLLGKPVNALDVLDRIVPGCIVAVEGEESMMKVVKVQRMRGGSGRLDHLKLTLI